jgi:hypothetical protein
MQPHVVYAKTETQAQCDAAFAAEDYVTVSVYCASASEEYAVDAEQESGVSRDADRGLQGLSLMQAAIANHQLSDDSKAGSQLDSAHDIFKDLLANGSSSTIRSHAASSLKLCNKLIKLVGAN